MLLEELKQSWQFSKKQLTTIELNSNCIKILQWEIDSCQKIKLLNYERLFLPRSAEELTSENLEKIWAEALQNYLQKSGIKIRKLIISISARECIFKRVVFPKLQDKELERAISWDIEEYLPKELNSYYYDFININKEKGEVAEQIEVFLLAVEKSLIDKLINFASQHDFILASITMDLLAIRNLIPVEIKNFILLEITPTAVIISLITERLPRAYTNCIWARTLSENTELTALEDTVFSRKRLIDTDEKEDGEQFTRELAQEITALLGETEVQIGKIAIEKIFIYGNKAQELENFELLVAETLLAVELLKPLQAITVAAEASVKGAANFENELAVGIGLAGMLTDKKAINLIPTYQRRQLFSTKILSIVSCCICLLAIAYNYWLCDKNYQEYQSLTAEQSELVLWEQRSVELQQIFEAYTLKEQLLTKISEKRNNWAAIFSELGTYTQEGVKIISIVQAPDTQYLLTLEANDVSVLSAYLELLENKKIIKKIVVQSIEIGKNIEKIQVKVKLSFVGVSNEKNNTKLAEKPAGK